MDERISMDRYDLGFTLDERGDTMAFDFAYPRQNKIKFLEVGLSDVRASDGIRIWYDFERDGYVIEQPQQLAWRLDEKIDEKWKEVAFAQSWRFEKEQKENEPK